MFLYRVNAEFEKIKLKFINPNQLGDLISN